MSSIKPIKNDADLDAALKRIEEIFQAETGTPEDDELGVLVVLVEDYEDRHYPIGPPTDPIAAIEFAMERRGLERSDLVLLIGSDRKVSEVLSGKRDITMQMARALHKHLDIPAETLLQEFCAEATAEVIAEDSDD